MPYLLLAIAFFVGALFGAALAFVLAARAYDRGYADALATASSGLPPPQSGEPIDGPDREGTRETTTSDLPRTRKHLSSGALAAQHDTDGFDQDSQI